MPTGRLIYYTFLTMPYAIIETGGKQYWVSPGDTLRVETLGGEPGAELVLPALWAVKEGEGGEAKAAVTAEVVRHGRSPKIIVFKKRPKSHYRRRAGHRQGFTEIRIKAIQ